MPGLAIGRFVRGLIGRGGEPLRKAGAEARSLRRFFRQDARGPGLPDLGARIEFYSLYGAEGWTFAAFFRGCGQDVRSQG